MEIGDIYIYIYLYHLTSLLMHAIGPKVWIEKGNNPHFLFPRVLRVQNRACLGGISLIDYS